MQRINRKQGFLIKFKDQTYEVAKRYTIDTSVTNMRHDIDYDANGESFAVVKPETVELNNDYLSYIDIGDSGTMTPTSNIYWIKAIKYKKIKDNIQTYTLDNKEFIVLENYLYLGKI